MVAYHVLRSWSGLIGKQGQVSQCMSLVQAWELVMEGRAGGHPFKCFFFFSLILFFWNKSKAHRDYNTVCLDLRLGSLFLTFPQPGFPFAGGDLDFLPHGERMGKPPAQVSMGATWPGELKKGKSSPNATSQVGVEAGKRIGNLNIPKSADSIAGGEV